MRKTWTFCCLTRKEAGSASGSLQARCADRAHALLSTSLDEPAKQLDVQARSAGRSRVPLNAEGKPPVVFRLDSLDDSIQGAGTDLKPACHPANSTMMFAVHHDFAFSIECG